MRDVQLTIFLGDREPVSFRHYLLSSSFKALPSIGSYLRRVYDHYSNDFRYLLALQISLCSTNH